MSFETCFYQKDAFVCLQAEIDIRKNAGYDTAGLFGVSRQQWKTLKEWEAKGGSNPQWRQWFGYVEGDDIPHRIYRQRWLLAQGSGAVQVEYVDWGRVTEPQPEKPIQTHHFAE